MSCRVKRDSKKQRAKKAAMPLPWPLDFGRFSNLLESKIKL